MKIALLTYSTKPRGGVVHTLALAEALAARGHDVTVWTLGRGGDAVFFRPVHPAVSVRVVPFAAEPDETVGDRIKRSISTLRAAFTEDYDVVHAQDCISANAVPWCIRTIHHLDHFTTPALADCHEKALVNPVARICVSAAVAAEVESGWGYTPAVIPNGVHAERYMEAAGGSAAAVAGRRFWQDRLGRYVLAVGGIEPRKGSIDLLEAFAGVLGAVPDARLPVLHEVLRGAAQYADGTVAITEAIVAALAGRAPAPEAGVALAQGYRWDAVAARHEDFYRQVLVAGLAARADAG